MEPVLKNLIRYDWIIIIYIILSILLVAARNNSAYKFLQFTRLVFSNTYTKTYQSNSLAKNFHLLLVSFTILFFPLQIQVIGSQIGFLGDVFFSDYFRFLILFLGYYVLKMILPLLIATVFNYQTTISKFIFFQQTYFAYVVFLGFFPILCFAYNSSIPIFWIYVFVCLWIGLYFLSFLLVVFSLKELLFSKLLYFILYICAFEISPIIGVIYFLRLQ